MRKKNTISVLLGLLTAVVLGMLLLVAQGYNPFEVYGSIIQYSLLSSFGITNTLNRMAILLLTGSSAAFAMRSGVSNLGQYGQLLTGAMLATLVGLYVPGPAILVAPLMLIVSAIGGALYAGLAALFRLKFKMNEFIATLMLNFVAALLTEYLVAYPFLDPNSNWPMSRVISKDVVLPAIGSLDSAFFISVLVAIGLLLYTQMTRPGYENEMMGKNILFSRYGGIKTEKEFVKVMLISGAVAGLAGGLMVAGASQQNRFMPNMGEGYGNDGLMVAIVSNFSIAFVFLYSFVFSILQSGSTGMQLDTDVPSEFTVMLIAITVLSVVAFRSYAGIFIDKMIMKKNEKKVVEGKETINGTH